MYKNSLDFFRNFLDWDAASYNYVRSTKDGAPYQIVKSEDKTKSTIIFNALGIKKDDVKIEIVREHGSDYLTINGETKNSTLNKTYSVSGRFLIDSEAIKSVEWDTKDGLLEIEVMHKQPEKSNISVKMK